MEKIVYTLKLNDSTNEYHLFEAKMTTNNKCTPEYKSICQKMTKDESSSFKFACATEEEARIKAAKIGRDVCGTCISHLYLG